MQSKAICHLEEIPDGEARSFTIRSDEECLEVFIVRKATAVFGYVNSCPHAQWPLEFIEDQFMTLDKRHIQCVNHGAWFEIETGICLGGPCKGETLRPFPIQLNNGWVLPCP